MPVLSTAEKQSPVWRKVVADLTERLANLHRKNATALDPVETAMVRGEIKEIQRLLDMDKDSL